MQDDAWQEHEKIQETYWWHRHKREFILHLAEEQPYERVLEIGSGGGILASRLKRRCRAITTDLSVRHVHPGGVVAKLPELCFKPAAFDLVILSEVLEHLDQPVESLKTIRRILRPGGRCIITVPAWPALWSSHDVFYGHKKRYTPNLLRSELSESGFDIQKKGWVFFMPLWAAFVRKFFIADQTPKSAFVYFPAFINNACYQYLRWIEQPFTFRMRLPLGLTYSTVAVKPNE